MLIVNELKISTWMQQQQCSQDAERKRERGREEETSGRTAEKRKEREVWGEGENK